MAFSRCSRAGTSIKYWNKLYLFCESDITQIQTSLNINRLCLILRFYDKNKYKEMCCQEHLNMVKDEYVGSRKVMNPIMNKKLSYLNNIMDLIICSEDLNKPLALFKLLTLDLSPCLIKFILNILLKFFEKRDERNKNNYKILKDKFVELLLQSKYEAIIINAFRHSLPDIRLLILKFLFSINMNLISQQKQNNFKTLEKMIKTCLLPDKMFYRKKIIKQSEEKNKRKINDNLDNNKINDIKKENNKIVEKKKEEPKKEVSKKEEPKKVEPKKEEPKKVELKKEEFRL